MKIPLSGTKHIALALGLAGLLGLLVLSPEYRQLEPFEVSEQFLGKKVLVLGNVRGLYLSNGNAFMALESLGSVRAVFFHPSASQLAVLREGGLVRAKGTVGLHQNGIEVIIDKVNRVD